MALKVIGSGFGRTGTMSMKLALETLGFGTCHHMEEVFEHPEQVPHWQAALRGEPVDWHALFAGYGAAVDWPSAHYWRELAEVFPEARIVHTVRSPESWWASYSETIMKFIGIGVTQDAGFVRDMSQWTMKVIGEETFGTDYTDRDAALRAFDRRIADVAAAIPADRLLIFDVKDGWEPLCDFLGLPVPETAFPRSNDRAEFWKNFSTEAA